MNTDLMFSKASDEWSTPQPLFDALHAEFNFVLDAAATAANRKCSAFLDQHQDALRVDWRHTLAGCAAPSVFVNPPYSKCREFIAKAASEAKKGLTVVCLVPSRTDTRWWSDYIWAHDKPRPGVEVRFIKGRLKFGEGKNSAPFPSVVIIFRGAR